MNNPTARQAQAQARYEALRTVLAAVLVTVVLASLVLILLTGREITRQGDAQARSDARVEAIGADLVAQTDALTTQGDTLEALLASQEADRADRAMRLAAAIAELTKLQQAQLDQHDADVTRRLQTILDEIGRLDFPPRTLQLPAAAPRAAPTRTTAPRPTPRTAPPPGPQPRPCQEAGNSGRCRK